MSQDFVHLHCHTHFSIQDALPTPAKLAMKARVEGYRAIAMTDHGKMAGAIEFVEGCRKPCDNVQPIKPIIGNEFYTCKNRFDKSKIKLDSGEEKRQKLNHLTVLAANKIGYENMLEMTYLASHPDVFHYSPRIDWDVLSGHSEGLIVLSGCLASEINQHLLADRFNEAKLVAERFKDLLGNRYFIELQYHGIEDQKKVLPLLIKIATDLDIQMVASNDVHYLNVNDWQTHDVLIQMRDLRDNKTKKGRGKLDAYSTHQFYLKNHEAMLKIFGDKVPSALSNSILISEMVDDYMQLDVPHLLPEAHIDFENKQFINFWKKSLPHHKPNEAYLAYLAFKGLRSVHMEANTTYVQRLKYEIETIWNMGVTDYFLIQKEIVNFLQSSNILFGLRGSGAGSLVNYCLDISDTDPIKWNLMFERFLNPGRGTQYKIDLECYPISQWLQENEKQVQSPFVQRLQGAAADYIKEHNCPEIGPQIQREIWVLENQGLAEYICSVADKGYTQNTNQYHLWSSYILGITNIKPEGDLIISKVASLPDIDTDISDDKRDDVIQWTKMRFGDDCVMPVGTWGTYGARSAVVNVLKASDKFIRKYPDNTNEMALKISATIPKRPDMTIATALSESYEFKAWAGHFPEEIANADKLFGTNANLGMHASAVVVSKNPIYRNSPIELSNKVLVTAFDMANVERVGLIKYDYLGLKALNKIEKCLKMIKTQRGIELDLKHIPLDDSLVFNKTYKRGATHSIFQCDSPGMQGALRAVEASNMEDIIAVLALYRPGPMDFIEDYARGKRNPSTIKYSHELIKKHLHLTHGIMVYQEQAMFLAQEMALLTAQEVDKLRKAISKKSDKDFDIACNLFKKRALKNNIPEDVIHEVLQLMSKFGGYAFNRSHACRYAILSYRTAYLRTYYAPEWFAACIQVDHDDEQKVSAYLHECRLDKINVRQPNVNESQMTVSVNTNGDIMMPLTTVKGVGAMAESIAINQPYTSLEDLVARAKPNKGIVNALSQVGGLDCLNDCLGLEPEEIMERWAEITTKRAKMNKKPNTASRITGFDTPIKRSLLDVKKSFDNQQTIKKIISKKSIIIDNVFEDL